MKPVEIPRAFSFTRIPEPKTNVLNEFSDVINIPEEKEFDDSGELLFSFRSGKKKNAEDQGEFQ